MKADDLVRLDKSKKPKASKVELGTVWYVTKVVGTQIHVASEFIQGGRIYEENSLKKVQIMSELTKRGNTIQKSLRGFADNHFRN